MAVHVPALSAKATAKAAIRKTTQVQTQLQAAQAELKVGHASLDEALRSHSERAILVAAEQNRAAETKVHDAVEKLDVVKQLLSHDHTAAAAGDTSVSRSGVGVKSIIPHLPKSSR